jgi:DNA topoisomerase IA
LAILLHKEYGDKEHGDDDDDDDEEEEQVIPEFRIGEYVPLIQSKVGSGSSNVEVASGGHPVWATLNVAEKMTTAPGYLTESELIGMMERHGIGTDASIPTHIENILKRNYVRLESGRRLIPNKLGMVLVNGYHQIDSGLVLPKVRSDIEGECNKIAKGVMKKVYSKSHRKLNSDH